MLTPPRGDDPSGRVATPAFLKWTPATWHVAAPLLLATNERPPAIVNRTTRLKIGEISEGFLPAPWPLRARVWRKATSRTGGADIDWIEIPQCGQLPCCSFPLDIGRQNHPAPLLGLGGDELAEIGGRPADHGAAQIGKPRLEFRICNADVHFLV